MGKPEGGRLPEELEEPAGGWECCAVEWAVLPLSGKMGVRGVVREEPVGEGECWIGGGFWRAGG